MLLCCLARDTEADAEIETEAVSEADLVADLEVDWEALVGTDRPTWLHCEYVRDFETRVVEGERGRSLATSAPL